MAPSSGDESGAKTEALALMDRRSAIEAEMQGIIDHLAGPDGPGFSGNLVDEEGFPRADVDIPRIRAERHRLTVLRTDHKDITAKIEEKLYFLLSGGSTKDTSSTPFKITATAPGGSCCGPASYPVAEGVRPQNASRPPVASGRVQATGPAPMEEDVQSSQPFAIFDQIAEGSPAALDGLRVGDQLIRFGTVEGGDSVLANLAQEYQSNEGRAVPVVVLRRGVEVRISVIPRRWSGNGLLGCHVQPL